VVRAAAGAALLALAAAALALFPTPARAHATLQDSHPGRGAQVQRAPERVTLRFDEPVEIAFGSVRVFDAAGERVDRGPAEHPGGRGEEVAVALRDGLGDGVYTATYRVVSADSHPVAGGFVFSVGAGGPAPRLGVDDLIEEGSAGPVTETAFGVVRASSYLAIALAVGGLAFALAVWRPALREAAGGGQSRREAAGAGPAPGWRAAGIAFATRSRRLVLAAAAAGALAAALGIVLQGATAAGGTFWSALDPAVIEEVLGTRFGTVWGLRLLAFLGLAALVAGPALRPARPTLRPALPAPARAVALGALALFICATPALAGHASTIDPALLIPANALHVGAMAVWVGGVATLLLALPAATRLLEPADRTALLGAAVVRFSTLAVLAVAALVASGVLQAIVELHSFADLWESAFGRAILVKSGLVVALIALGAWNRTRARTRLARQAAAGESPGRTGLLLRRALRAEVALMAAVLAATAALASYAPPSTASGPFSATADLGPARLDLTVDPARAGANELHLYLFSRSDGTQFDRVKELTVSARLPERRIGPLDLSVHKAGPGHWLVRRADVAPAGEWRLDVSARVSEFDAYTARVEVSIR
jgi:copper transport protein